MDRREGPTLLEVIGLVGATVLATVALASLLLAWAGAHDGITALAVGVAAGIALTAVLVRRRRDWSFAAWSWPDAAALAGVLLVGAVLFFPGFPYAAMNRDPGVYVNHAVAIADQGSTTLDDPVADTGAEIVVREGEPRIITTEGDVGWRKLPYRGFPTDPEDPGRILPDFFHLWPASMATAMDVGGRGGLFNLAPALALAAVGLVWLAVRRTFGTIAATVAGGLLAVNELQVWQAKYPSAEALSQFLYAAALLAVVVAIRTRWRLAAVLAGGFVGLSFVARPEGILVVGLAAVAVAVAWAVPAIWREWRGPLLAFVAGLVPPLLVGTYQAYGTGSRYVEAQEGIPGLPVALAGAVALVLGAVVLRLLVARAPAPPCRRVGYALLGLYVAFLLLALLRPVLFGESFRVDKAGQRTRGYDEVNLHRLLIFVTPVALVAAVGALWVGIRERWDAARWALVLPGLVIAPVLIWEPHIAPDLMWWTRRYVPVVVPTLLVLLGIAAARLWAWTGPRRRLVQAGAAVVVLLVGAYTFRQATDLWGHEELGGSLAVIDGVDDAVPDDAVVVWQGGTEQVTNFAVTPFTWLGLPGIAGPPRPTEAGLLALQEALDGRPLYLVTDGTEPPPEAADALEPVAHLTGELHEFEHSFDARPRRDRPQPYELTVWRLT